jgi:hypothetical protein
LYCFFSLTSCTFFPCFDFFWYAKKKQSYKLCCERWAGHLSTKSIFITITYFLMHCVCFISLSLFNFTSRVSFFVMLFSSICPRLVALRTKMSGHTTPRFVRRRTSVSCCSHGSESTKPTSTQTTTSGTSCTRRVARPQRTITTRRVTTLSFGSSRARPSTTSSSRRRRTS